ncbi:hypothetical protein GOBAR_AA18539 [Gossypium barbadense]|uniref:Uncharacterized protein n=1 Tax=Gossypium barbadense TaxID=3634 RepID=A0A2P5XFM2_GOSBA|nr:hypothetical protein GOBAR_AA18539 [Gossypium barbadense]
MHSFFVDVNLFKANKERAAGIAKSNNDIVGHVNNGSSTSTMDGLANEDANLMIKLKFLTYKLRTFLIRNGLSILFKDGPAAYRAYYLRLGNHAQMLRASLSTTQYHSLHVSINFLGLLL